MVDEEWRGTSAAQRSLERRRRILDAATELVGLHGVGAVTVRGVSVAANVGPRYFYESFANVEDLLLAIYDESAERLLAAAAGGAQGDTGEPLRQRVERILEAAADFLATPNALSFVDAAPLMCAGVTTFNGLRNSGARAGDLVAVLGVGGLGHLGVQFAAKMGFETVAIARGAEKEPFARELGAHHYIDSTSADVDAELNKLGGAKVVLATVTDSEDTLRFAALTGIRPMVETYPLVDAAAGSEHMMSGKARFRVALTTE